MTRGSGQWEVLEAESFSGQQGQKEGVSEGAARECALRGQWDQHPRLEWETRVHVGCVPFAGQSDF